MNTLRKTGLAFAATGLFLGGCSSAEQAPHPSPERPSVSSTFDYSTPNDVPSTSTISETPEASKDISSISERHERMRKILGQACLYVEKQDSKVRDGFPNVYSPGSPMSSYNMEYDKLLGPGDGIVDAFQLDMKKTCEPYAIIYSRNNG